jgi:hypothetical protein
MTLLSRTAAIKVATRGLAQAPHDTRAAAAPSRRIASTKMLPSVKRRTI